ncbi:hypothetical protein QVD17_10479 [Tagetes erecta]|uniref:PPIase cyclophilin-type domain-containing protein n=1 Tax=Tagetes erecta TaxID=13708 RepID=A0AAD8L5U7_TARER|nr:hypothetical protein QVD17_10479 [Tagetes erecta]
MIIELFADVVPRTAENFRAICVGSVSATGKFLHYKGRVFSTINKGLFALTLVMKASMADLFQKRIVN